MEPQPFLIVYGLSYSSGTFIFHQSGSSICGQRKLCEVWREVNRPLCLLWRKPPNSRVFTIETSSKKHHWKANVYALWRKISCCMPWYLFGVRYCKKDDLIFSEGKSFCYSYCSIYYIQKTEDILWRWVTAINIRHKWQQKGSFILVFMKDIKVILQFYVCRFIYLFTYLLIGALRHTQEHFCDSGYRETRDNPQVSVRPSHLRHEAASLFECPTTALKRHSWVFD